MRKLFRTAAVLAAMMALSAGLSVSAFAATSEDKDYEIGDAAWDLRADGLWATWDEPEDSTGYKVQLYKGEKKVGSTVSGRSSEDYDFTATIISKGNGTYYFTVYPSKVKSSEREDFLVQSDEITIGTSDSADITLNELKELHKNKQETTPASNSTIPAGAKGPGGTTTNTSNVVTPGTNTNTATTANGYAVVGGGAMAFSAPAASTTPASNNQGWAVNSVGKWTYRRADGQSSIHCWENINGQWYYFDANGEMLTGWQWITGNDGQTLCYYLEPGTGAAIPQGACYMNTTTPDGYTVNENGAWIVNGVLQTK